jgi:hypothetical protein
MVWGVGVCGGEPLASIAGTIDELVPGGAPFARWLRRAERPKPHRALSPSASMVANGPAFMLRA